ncbi:hypothetical protein L210DRAFT_3641004 [Boletus edulis BED1]|uniref:F-box domain-containing protein n=1 Tax=Boletus edulis BED1 TaxID=1328754 RepID=A0AAD4C732_BOLED|nr:hypothetical protein L210DRAFT_3641004 [Boletus edulis BED1]
MSDSTALSLSQLPPESLHVVFCYLDIPDVLRMRRVSRYLNGISHSRQVWTNAYRTAEFVRPPGPFLWQSTYDLEKALVCSFRVHWNLLNGGGPAQTEIQACKLREIRYTGIGVGVSLVFGQFLVIGFKEEVRCHDLKLEASDASIIYQSPGGMLRGFNCFSAVDVEGRPYACAMSFEDTETSPRFSIYSLHVGEQSRVTLDLLHQFNAPRTFSESVSLGPRVIVFQNDMNRRVVAMDVHTRTQFLIPSIHAVMEAARITESAPIEGRILPTSISTSTHVVLALSYLSDDRWRTYFQAFALPPSNTHRGTSTSAPLNPSHSGVIFDIQIHDYALLHDAIVESPTQDVLIAIQVQPTTTPNPARRHGILRLSTDGTITFQLLGSLGQTSYMCSAHSSFHGMGRAFMLEVTGAGGFIGALDYYLRPGGNEIEVSESRNKMRCAARHSILDYDPYSGRICLGSYLSSNTVIEIMDLAV